ncbi:hypothetical protein KL86PLE_30194 [uncultured Pleomorphomonas sp.]|nr:hypothetical protein KL86PLE_30194 [uncultured Pleomorphomonas sp.]
MWRPSMMRIGGGLGAANRFQKVRMGPMSDMRDELLEPVEATVGDNFKHRAMTHMERAFDDADDDGIPVDAVAHAALFAALTTLVECFGEESVARLVAELPEKISSGGYTLLRTLQ